MHVARSEVSVLRERWIKEPSYSLESAWDCANEVLGIMQMECLGLCKWSAWDCANGVLGIMLMVVTTMRICCAGETCMS